MKKFHSALFDFCWFPNYDASIEYLANNIADPEPWDFSDATQAKYSILKSYIEHTFRKIKSENKISFSSDNKNGIRRKPYLPKNSMTTHVGHGTTQYQWLSPT